jgi:hypothetical protein
MKAAFLAFLGLVSLSLVLLGAACGNGGQAVNDNTPTGAYKRLFTAVKSKNTEAIKKELSKRSIEFGVMFAQRSGKSVEQAYENGFTATTFSPTLPEIRDERVKDNMGAVEVYNSRDKTWEDLPFVYEDGAWKLAVGDLFAGTYQSPGKGRDLVEKEAANAQGNSSLQMVPAANMNVAPMKPANAGNADK